MADVIVSADIDTLMLAADFPAAKTAQGLGTGDSPQFAGVNVGAATDTTVTRASAGVIAVEGKNVYMAGGADVAVADGATLPIKYQDAWAALIQPQTGSW